MSRELNNEEWSWYYSKVFGVPIEIMNRNNPNMKTDIIKELTKQLSNVNKDIKHCSNAMKLKDLHMDKNSITEKIMKAKRFL